MSATGEKTSGSGQGALADNIDGKQVRPRSVQTKPRRLEADEPTARGRDANGPARVGAMGDGDDARRDQGRRPARGAAARSRRIMRIAAGRPAERFGRHAEPNLWARTLAEHHQAALLHPGRDGVGPSRHVSACRPRAPRRPHAAMHTTPPRGGDVKGELDQFRRRPDIGRSVFGLGEAVRLGPGRVTRVRCGRREVRGVLLVALDDPMLMARRSRVRRSA